ncbi:MAG: hypothetical protein E6212_08340 [Actinomyces sp.]|nr:hypothetical protein [Actinomyces sp.]
MARSEAGLSQARIAHLIGRDPSVSAMRSPAIRALTVRIGPRKPTKPPARPGTSPLRAGQLPQSHPQLLHPHRSIQRTH